MSLAQQRLLALWAALLSGVLCLGFLPVPRLAAVLILLAICSVIAANWMLNTRRSAQETTTCLDDVPEASYRQPVVLVCGDLPQAWPELSPVLTVTSGCWVRVEDHQEMGQVARQLLYQRPDWGRQLSVMVSIRPQQHADTQALTSRLLALRWQISQLRREIGQGVPVVLNVEAGSAVMNDLLWQAAMPGENLRVWRDSSAPSSVAAWISAGGATAMQQQVLMNSLISWCDQYVNAVFMDKNPDIPPVVPTAVLWGLGPMLTGSLASSNWTDWLQQHTGLQQVAGWHPVATGSTVICQLPNFVLPLLPQGQGLTSSQRSWRRGLSLFTLAAIVALLCSGWSNHQLLHRLRFDIQHYERIARNDHGPKAEAVKVLRADMAQLDSWVRNGEPLRMSLGLYRGENLRIPLLDAIRSYVPPPPSLSPSVEKHEVNPLPTIVRLNSMSLFDSGKAVLKAGSTNMLVDSLIGIKARPGWLIVVAGHTDNTGNPTLNQALSLKRAAAVRDWMRDSGEVPESCFAVQGYGESRPLAPNATPEGRAQNRRVEISLVPQADACQIPGNPLVSSPNDAASQHPYALQHKVE